MCAIVLSLIPLLSHAHDWEIDGNYYTLISTSEKTVRFDGTSNSGNLVIPETIMVSGKTLTVVDIKKFAFNNNGKIQNVTIPKTIVMLGEQAMSEGSFEKVILPNNMTSIGKAAFKDCTKLKQINLPQSLEEIGEYAFSGCSNLESIELPPHITTINDGCFANTGLKNLNIPSRIIKIYGKGNCRCFESCNIDTVVFEDSREPIYIKGFSRRGHSDNKGEFDNNDHIDYVYIGRNINTTCLYMPSVLYGRPDFDYATTIIWGDSCTSMLVEVEQYTTNPYYYKYSQAVSVACSKMENVVFGKNLEIIAPFDYWYDGRNLKNIYLRSSTPQPAVGFHHSTYVNGTLYVPRGTLKAYQEADVWKEFWNIVEYDVKELSSTTYQKEGVTNSLAKVETKSVQVQSSNGVLTITSEGNTEVTPIKVYNTAGQMVSSSSMTNGMATLDSNMDSGEIAIVKIGEKSVKVVVK